MSPPPELSKKLVAKFRSVKSIVMPPANTGKDNSSKKAVTNIAHTNNGILNNVKPLARQFKIVVIKFIAPAIEEAPAICKLKIAKSTEAPE